MQQTRKSTAEKMASVSYGEEANKKHTPKKLEKERRDEIRRQMKEERKKYVLKMSLYTAIGVALLLGIYFIFTQID